MKIQHLRFLLFFVTSTLIASDFTEEQKDKIVQAHHTMNLSITSLKLPDIQTAAQAHQAIVGHNILLYRYYDCMYRRYQNPVIEVLQSMPGNISNTASVERSQKCLAIINWLLEQGVDVNFKLPQDSYKPGDCALSTLLYTIKETARLEKSFHPTSQEPINPYFKQIYQNFVAHGLKEIPEFCAKYKAEKEKFAPTEIPASIAYIVQMLEETVREQNI
jgi:hypothetical protein